MSHYIVVPGLIALSLAGANVFKQYMKTKSSNILALKEEKCDAKNKNKRKQFIVQDSIISEARILFKLGLYIGMSMIFEMGILTVSMIFVGQLSNSSQLLSAMGITTSFSNGTILVLSWGFLSALFTLIPQAIGANQPYLVALYAQRAFVVFISVYIPLITVLIYIKEILLFVGVNSQGNIDWNIITNFAYRMIPTIFLTNILSILHRVMQNINYSSIIFIIQMFIFFMSIPLSYLFIIGLNFGIYGSIYVHNLCQLFSIILSILFLISKGYLYIFKPLSFSKIYNKKGLYQYLKLGIPGCLQMFLMWNIREFIMLLTGCINDNSANAATITYIMIHLLYMSKFLHNGIGNAANIRIGKYIGAQNIIYAKRTIKIQMFFIILLFIIFYIIYILFRYEITNLFTSDQEIIELIANIFIYIVLIYSLAAAIYKNIDSVYRALGFQKISAVVICCTQYLIAFPLQLYLLFSSKYNYNNNMKLGIYFIWIPSIIASFLGSIILICLLLYYIDWNNVVNESKLRIKINNQITDDKSNQTQLKYALVNMITKTNT